MRQNHQRGIEKRLAEVTSQVRKWALENGWQYTRASNSAMYRVDGEQRRLHLAPRYLQEQVWKPLPDTRDKGIWVNIHSCPWSLVRIENGQLIREQNAVRAFGTKLEK